MARLSSREGVLFTGRPAGTPGPAAALAGWLLGATRAKASSRRECIVWRASSMDGWGRMYCGAGKGRPGYRPSSVEDGVCTSAGRSGSDYSGDTAKEKESDKDLSGDLKITIKGQNGTEQSSLTLRKRFP